MSKVVITLLTSFIALASTGCKRGIDRVDAVCLEYVNATDTDARLASSRKCLVEYVKETFDKDPSYDPFKAGGAARTLHESSVLGHIESACTEAKSSGDDGKRGSCKALCTNVATFRTKYSHFYVGDDVNPPATELRSLCATLDVLVPKPTAKPASRAKVTE